MLISIITPTRNRAASFLTKTIESVADAKFGKSIEIEHIIVDDGSTDDTTKKITSMQKNYPHLKLITNPTNIGITASKNKALKIARGELIIDLDDDDLLPFYSISLRTKLLKSSGKRWLRGNAFQIDEKGVLLNSETLVSKRIKGRYENFIAFYESKIFAYTGTRIYYKTDLERLNGWNESYKNTGEDLDLWLRMSYYIGEPAYCGIPLVFFRKKADSTGINDQRSGKMDEIVADIRRLYSSQYQDAKKKALQP